MERNKIRRCAIYTRKSSEEGLEQEFNSLYAQREACEAFIRSQAGEGWRLIKSHYDDGGLSGATMERPALQRLMADIEKKLVDAVVVYKVDRLTQSLADFVKMVEVFDAREVSFVAVTQQFNTTTSMGRLTLNVLLSFAQFEREVTGERIRDKVAASKRKGLWMGGMVPLGYDARNRQLEVNQDEAAAVKHIFVRYHELGSVRLLKEELDRDGVRSKRRISKHGVESGGSAFSGGALYTLLKNPIYVGKIRHKGACHPGQHAQIVDRATWDTATKLLRDHTARPGVRNSRSESSPLIGKLFDENGDGLTPTHAVKGDRRYRYYVSRSLIKGATGQAHDGWRLPAAEIEHNVAIAAKSILDNHDALATLIERVELRSDGMSVSLKLPLSSPAEGALDNGSTHLSIARWVAMRIRRRGVELRLVIDGDHGASRKTDQALLSAVARAHCWFDDLASGRCGSMVEIAHREGIGKQYVSRLLRLAFLAPAIVEQIAEGRQPPELTAQALLTGLLELPVAWEAQRQTLEFARPA